MSRRRAPAGPTVLDPWQGTGMEKIRALIFGHTGHGKTGLACTAPKPLILDLEDGAKITVRAVGNRDARLMRIQSLRELRDAYAWLAGGDHGFETVVLDPMGDLQRWLLEEALDKYPQKRAFNRVNTMQDWGLVTEDYKKLLEAFMALPMHLIVNAHARQRDRDEELVTPLLQGQQMVSYTLRRMDLVGYMYKEASEEGQVVRKLLTTSNGTIEAKNRGERLPLIIENPNMTEIISIMTGAD